MTVARESEIEARIRSRGLRATRPRVMAYRVLLETGGHLSVDDIWGGLKRLGWSITRMTIYNVVTDLERAGLVMLADAGPGRALYEAAESWHHHFVCRKCGAVLDVPCVVGEKPCLDAEFDEGVVDEAQVIFRGVCKNCLFQREEDDTVERV